MSSKKKTNLFGPSFWKLIALLSLFGVFPLWDVFFPQTADLDITYSRIFPLERQDSFNTTGNYFMLLGCGIRDMFFISNVRGISEKDVLPPIYTGHSPQRGYNYSQDNTTYHHIAIKNYGEDLYSEFPIVITFDSYEKPVLLENISSRIVFTSSEYFGGKFHNQIRLIDGIKSNSSEVLSLDFKTNQYERFSLDCTLIKNQRCRFVDYDLIAITDQRLVIYTLINNGITELPKYDENKINMFVFDGYGVMKPTGNVIESVIANGPCVETRKGSSFPDFN